MKKKYRSLPKLRFERGPEFAAAHLTLGGKLMTGRHLPHRWATKSLLALGIFLSAWMPAHAVVSTVYTCPPGGHSGSHDYIFNGFFVQNLDASNLHTVTIYYTTDVDGTFTLTLTARRGTFGGPQIGQTLTKTISLSSSADTAVTWNFEDTPFSPGSTVNFTHGGNGTGVVRFSTHPQSPCDGDDETVGGGNNGISIAVTITQNIKESACVPDAETLCISDQPGDKRFQIRVSYATSQGGGLSGNGRAVPLSSLGVTQGGLFWFFALNNPELLIKILNACAANGHFWVYFSAGTNVGFHVGVTDIKTGHVLDYTNPDLTAAPPLQDTSTLTCP
jgi:hypothetical protein